MTDKLPFPYRLANAFFASLNFQRSASVPDDLRLELFVQVRIHTENLPKRLQLDLKVETGEKQPVIIGAKLIGLFELVEGQSEPDTETVQQFINDRALFMLFPLIRQVIRQTSAVMGVSPLDIKVPYYFGFDTTVDNGDTVGVIKT